MAKVSVIIPVYGVENYIERCARSLFEQTLDDVEYLFIDDCTPDKSMEILKCVLDEYPNRQAQVVIHRMEHNSGQAAVRKWGIQNASGDYIIHCDSDDWVDVDMYKLLYDKAVEVDADVVVCDYYTCHDASRKYVRACYTTDKFAFMEDILFYRSAASLWNKLIRKSLYMSQDLIFPMYSMAEDMTLVTQLLWNCNSITHVPQALYYYDYNGDSISNNSNVAMIEKRFNDSCNNMSLLNRFFIDKHIPRSLETAMIFAKNWQRNQLLPLVGIREYYDLWKKTYPEINTQFFIRTGIPIKDKLRYIIVWMHLYPKLRKYCLGAI